MACSDDDLNELYVNAMSAANHIPELVKKLYALVGEFEHRFPGRKFTPDGHLVGSIGEVVAASRYNLRLLPASTEGHDAQAANGLRVQIKATQGTGVALRSEPEHLLVLKINKDGTTQEVFNGPGDAVWKCCGVMQKNGQRPISLKRLQAIQKTVLPCERLPETSQ